MEELLMTLNTKQPRNLTANGSDKQMKCGLITIS